MRKIISLLVFSLILFGCSSTEPSNPVPVGKLKAIYCTDTQRQGNICTMDYVPVCGWFNQDIKCTKYPCAQTFGNSCGACHDDKVDYYTEGECPDQNVAE